MSLLPGWKDRIDQAPPPPKMDAPPRTLPLALRHFVDKVIYVCPIAAAQKMLEFALQRPLSYIGWDTEFKFDRPGVEIKKNVTVFDPHSIHPLLLSLALVEPGLDGGQISCFVVDLRKPELLPYLTDLFRLPVRFVGHFVKVEHFCLWKLGLPEPGMLWDTWVAEKARYLGKAHFRYKLPRNPDEDDEARAKDDAEDDDQFFNSLVPTCHRHGVAYKMAADKKRLQQSFLSHPDGASFTEEQIAYAGEDAIAAALLFPKQVSAAIHDGTLHHLETVEMTWVRTNARVEWNGIKINDDRAKSVASACSAHLASLEEQLAIHGISNFRSHKMLCEFFAAVGLLPLFKKDGKYTFERKQLELHLDCHPALSILYLAPLLSQRYILKFLFPYVLNRLAQKSEMKRFEFKTLIWVMPLHANLQGASHEFWPNRVFASDGFSAVA